MNPILKNVLAVVIGIIIGMVVNMGTILVLNNIILPPVGVDPSDMESIKANIDNYKYYHFIPPFLAHAGGTLAGACFAAWFAASKKYIMAMIIGVFFLAGGIASILMIPGPTWFVVLDIVGAYIPMAMLGHKLVTR